MADQVTQACSIRSLALNIWDEPKCSKLELSPNTTVADGSPKSVLSILKTEILSTGNVQMFNNVQEMFKLYYGYISGKRA